MASYERVCEKDSGVSQCWLMVLSLSY